MKKTKTIDQLEELKKYPFFTVSEAKKLGLSSRMISYYCKKGVIARLDRGIYQVKGAKESPDFEYEYLAQIARSIPNSTICLISALSIYDLTDEIMRENWIAIPHSTSAKKRPDTRIIRMRNTSLGRETKIISGKTVHIFDRERTVLDAFRYLDKEIAIKSLKMYLRPTKKYRPNINKLESYAKELKTNITSFIMALTT